MKLKKQIKHKSTLIMENDISFSIKLIRFSKPNAEIFSAILDLAEFGLQPAWKIVNTTKADFYLLTGKPKTHNYKGLPRDRCFYYSTGAVGTNKANAIPVDASQIPRLHLLQQLLNQAASQTMSVASTAVINNQPLEQVITPVVDKVMPISATKDNQSREQDTRQAMVSTNPSTPVSNDKITSSFFNPQQGFIKYFLEATTPVVFRLSGLHEKEYLYINPDQQTFYCSIPLKELTSSFSFNDGLSASVLTLEKLLKMVKKTALHSRPLNHLIWYSAVHLSQGRLMQGNSSQDIIRLIQWPYLGNDNPDYIKLTALLRKDLISLDSAAKETGVTLARAIDFYNACYLIGLIENKTLPNNINLKKKGWLNTIKKKFK